MLGRVLQLVPLASLQASWVPHHSGKRINLLLVADRPIFIWRAIIPRYGDVTAPLLIEIVPFRENFLRVLTPCLVKTHEDAI